MIEVMRTLLLVGLATLISTMTLADVYKYVDADGHAYFTDTPLQGNRYRLEWHRESQTLASKSQQTLFSRTLKQALAIVPSNATETSTRTVTPDISVQRRRAIYHGLVVLNARRYQLSPGLIHAVIRAESAYNPSAVSAAGAQGLMQLMPGTAARYGVSDSFNPVENVRAGAAYLRDLLDLFDQDLKLALAGYNAGEGAVIRYGRTIPPYSETQGYVSKVLEYYRAEQPVSIAMTPR